MTNTQRDLLIAIVRCVRKYPQADELGVAAYIHALVEQYRSLTSGQ